MESLSILDLNGKTAILNGGEGLHTIEEYVWKSLFNNKKEIVVIDDLYNQPEKIKLVIDCDNIILSTTGEYADDLKKVTDAFEKLNYAPKIVIFITYDTADILCDVARRFKKNGTKFYSFDSPEDYDGIQYNTLHKINWI